MPAPAYATSADLATWLGTAAPANAAALLRTAAYRVREATATAFYAADPVTGLPTATNLVQAFKDATCSHAAFLFTEGIDPNSGGTHDPSVESSAGVGSGQVTFADANAAATIRWQALQGLCPEAWLILKQSGLRFGAPWLVG